MNYISFVYSNLHVQKCQKWGGLFSNLEFPKCMKGINTRSNSIKSTIVFRVF